MLFMPVTEIVAFLNSIKKIIANTTFFNKLIFCC